MTAREERLCSAAGPTAAGGSEAVSSWCIGLPPRRRSGSTGSPCPILWWPCRSWHGDSILSISSSASRRADRDRVRRRRAPDEPTALLRRSPEERGPPTDGVIAASRDDDRRREPERSPGRSRPRLQQRSDPRTVIGGLWAEAGPESFRVSGTFPRQAGCVPSAGPRGPERCQDDGTLAVRPARPVRSVHPVRPARPRLRRRSGRG